MPTTANSTKDGDPGVVSHIKARFERPALYPRRTTVPDSLVSWDVPWTPHGTVSGLDRYQPPYFVAPSVLENDGTSNPGGWADPEDFSKIAHQLLSYEGAVRTDAAGKPLNPRGRTGLQGRGLLGKWGANFAADPIITRTNPSTHQLEMLAIRRRDNGQWAIPGGMVDNGEAVIQTLARELREETGVELDFAGAAELYRGYVDDPRNTDNAWMETTVRHLHLSVELASRLKPIASKDAAAIQWMQLDEQHLQKMYASHADFVRKAIDDASARVVNKAKWVDLKAGEAAAIDQLAKYKPANPQRLVLFADPNKDPDDMATYVLAKGLSDKGFVDITGLVTTLGDASTRTKRARFAREVFAQMGMPDVPVAPGRDYVLDDEQIKEHAKFLGDEFQSPLEMLQTDSAAMVRQTLAAADDQSVTLTVIAGMTDAAALLREEPDLVRQKVNKIVIMGGMDEARDTDGFLKPDKRSYNNTTDFAAAESLYRNVQQYGIPLTVVTKEAAYAAAIPREFYDEIASTDHPVGKNLSAIQQKALAGLWDGIQRGLNSKLSKEWFLDAFTGLSSKSAEAKPFLEREVAFEKVWPQVAKLNLYDPLTLLASIPGAEALLFKPKRIESAARSPVQVIGRDEVSDSGLARNLMSALGICALRGQRAPKAPSVGVVPPHVLPPFGPINPQVSAHSGA